MLSTSAFAPLAASVRAMLKEEQFHLGTGNNGLRRILKAGKIPTAVIQRYLNKWISTAYDLFGTDHSSSAQWAYVWGLKGRYDEESCDDQPDMEMLNDRARNQYRAEVDGLIAALNKVVPAGQPALFTPDMRFNRKIGQHADEQWSVTGQRLDTDSGARHLAEVMPTADDRELLANLCKGKGWIEPKRAGGEH